MHIKNRYKLFEKAEEKLSKELDIEYFVRTMRKVQMLFDSTMDDSERFLSNFQHFNVLRLHSDDSSDHSDTEENLNRTFKKVV